MTAQGITIVAIVIHQLLCFLFPIISQILNCRRIFRIRDSVRTVIDNVCKRRMEKYSRIRGETTRFGSLQNQLDDSKVNSLLSNSGGALPSCSRGKTMREFEAELADLKQENFELKMQLYVLEEQKEALEDERDAVELRINYQKLMKEFEKARSDILEKDDLILKAGEAMSLMSKKHEEDLCILQSRAAEEIEAYKQTISKLEQEILELKEKSFFMPKPAVFDDSSAMYAMAFNIGGNVADNRGTHSQEKVTELQGKIVELKEELRFKSLEVEKLCEKSASLELEAERLRKAESELKKRLQDKLNSSANSNLSAAENQIKDVTYKISQFEKDKKIQQSKPDGEGRYCNIVFRTSKKETDSRKSDWEIELETTKAELEELKKEKTTMLKGMQALLAQNNKLSRDIERLKSKPDERRNLSSEKREYEGISLAHKCDEKSKSDSEIPEMDDPEKSYLYSALEDKRKQVEQLNEKLRKRTIDLQELVNKELWSKNKEIEKLNRVCEKQVRDWSEQRTKLKSQETDIKALREEIERLRHELNTRINLSSATQNINGRESTEKSQDNLVNVQLKTLRDELEKQIGYNAELNSRCEDLRISAETSEKSRKDLMNACCLLTTRLEELSSFLESLLPSLAGRKRRLVKEAIDRSREMSKSLSLSCLEESSILCKSIEPILPDVSQVDFNSEEDLDDTLLHSNVTTLEEKNNEVMQLRSQMDSLVQKLKDSSPEIKRKSGRSQASPWSLSGSLQEQRPFSPQPFDESSLFGDCIPGIALEDITEGTGIESFDTDTEAKSKKRRDSEIKTLNMKIKRLEMTIESLISEKNGNLPANINNNVSVECQAVGDGTLTHNLMAEIKEQREKLMLSLSHNDFIRQRLEEVLSSAPSSPTKGDGDKSSSYDHNLLQQVIKMTDKLEESCSLCLELETKYMESEKEKLSLIEMLNASEEKVHLLSAELTTLKCSLKEKENELLEKQCALLEMKNSVIILESRVKLSQEEAQKQNRLLETLSHENEQKTIELSQKWEKERAELISRYDEEISRLKIKAKELEVDLFTTKSELGKVKEEKEIMEGEYKILFDRLEREKRDVLDKESQRRIEAEERLNEAVRVQAELRMRLDSEANKIVEIETGQKLSERAWRRRVAALESTGAETEARLRRKLDQLTLSNSEAVLERTRLANERLVLQRDHAQVKFELERRVTELELANHELEARLASLSKPDTVPTSPIDFKRQRSNPSSDYTSDHEHHNWFPACVRTNNSSSPDLGIESDNRMSSLEALSSPKPNGEDRPDKLELENVELRAQLARTKQALEETISQLTSANQRKRQVEKAICRQLHKTHDILKQARLNLDGKDKPVI
ncbi:centrosomin isoform X7 [Halyomorpha halys]|uniref:centrosomin isoform X7 n=1 Tax=Halyomorpha halys TaxID=286706 RepID=UPI0006D4F7F2|nr:centrosomin isoform X6 [Halyomorpha halys]